MMRQIKRNRIIRTKKVFNINLVGAKRQGKHMGKPGQDEKTLKRAIKLYNERETNGMSVNDIVKATSVPRYMQKKKAYFLK